MTLWGSVRHLVEGTDRLKKLLGALSWPACFGVFPAVNTPNGFGELFLQPPLNVRLNFGRENDAVVWVRRSLFVSPSYPLENF